MWGVTGATHRRMCGGILSSTKFTPAKELKKKKKGVAGVSKNAKLFYRKFH